MGSSAHISASKAIKRRRVSAKSAATPPGTMRSIISRWPNARRGEAQHALAQHGAMGEHQGEMRHRCRSRRCRRDDWRAAPVRPSAPAATRRAAAARRRVAASTAWAKAKRIGDGANRPRCGQASRAAAAMSAPAISPSIPLWTYPSRSSSRTMVSPAAVKRKCPGSMMPAWTGPTGIWCRLSPSTGRNG